MILLATESFTPEPRMMIRSFRRREYISYARSPAWVFSMTVGINMSFRIGLAELLAVEFEV